MLSATLYNNTSDNAVIDKNLTEARQLSLTVLADCSILKPRLSLKWNDSLTNVNYLYIPFFRRYYFITEISTAPGGLAIITAAVDVLMTYKESIKALPAIVIRAARTEQKGSARSSWIYDSSLPLATGRTIKAVELEGSALNIDTATMTSPNFVLNVAGGGAISA